MLSELVGPLALEPGGGDEATQDDGASPLEQNNKMTVITCYST